uniref:Uncharacterized protein n=1 Tax=Leptobrachium leishanense TaxID=445787 RepID=A0A8C5RCR0_9ANUR
VTANLEAAENSSAHRVTFLGPETQDVEVTPKKLGKLTVKYNRKELQRRIKLEEWIDSQIEALYLSQVRAVPIYLDWAALLLECWAPLPHVSALIVVASPFIRYQVHTVAAFSPVI